VSNWWRVRFIEDEIDAALWRFAGICAAGAGIAVAVLIAAGG
jgi:hypothetical protein